MQEMGNSVAPLSPANPLPILSLQALSAHELPFSQHLLSLGSTQGLCSGKEKITELTWNLKKDW